LPTGQDIMRLPPFDRPLPLVTIRPEGTDGNGRLPDRLVTLPPLPEHLPPVSQELVMNMFRDKEGMMALAEAGLMTMAKSAETDPAVIARVVDLIVDGPALSQSDQLSANGVNGKPFALGEEGFAVPRDQLLHAAREVHVRF
jgi:blue copper oxidase